MTMRNSTGELTRNAAMDEYFAGEFARTPAHIGYALTLLPRSLDLAEILAKIPIPTLLLVPGGGTKTPQEVQREMARSIPNCRMKIYEGAKHSMYHLTPDPLAQDALAFIRSI